MSVKNVVYFVVFAVLFGFTAWVVVDRAQLFAEAESQEATVVSCKSSVGRTSGGRGRARRWITFYAPVAISESGDKAEGSRGFSERSWCEALIGQKTTILVVKNEPSRNAINSFSQLWLFPWVAAFCLAFMFFVRDAKAFMVTFVGFFVIAGGALAYEFGVFNRVTGVKPVANEGRSQLALDQCIKEGMTKEGVTSRRDLKKLNCNNLKIVDIAGLADYTGLEELYLSGNDLTSLEPLWQLVNLRKLVLHKNRRLTSLKGLENLKALEELQARQMEVKDISVLGNLQQLQILDLDSNNIEDISSLAGLDHLQTVHLNRNPITSLKALADKQQLKLLTFYFSNVSDISPLYGNQNMKTVGVRGKGNVDCGQIDEMRRRLSPDAKVTGQEACD